MLGLGDTLVESTAEAQKMLDYTIKVSNEIGFTLDPSKTEMLCFWKGKNSIDSISITHNGHTIKPKDMVR